MNTKLLAVHKKHLRTDLPDIRSGMKVKVWYKIPEKEKTRTSFFEGIVIAVKHGRKNLNSTFTVRKIAADNVGVEMTWPLHSPVIEKIEVLNVAKTRRNKLYYLRQRSHKQVKSKLHKKKEFKELEIIDQPLPEEEGIPDKIFDKQAEPKTQSQESPKE